MYEKEILDIYQKCGVRHFPIDVIDVLQKCGYVVKTYVEIAKTTAHLRTLMSLSNDGFTYGKKEVYYNDGADRRRIRFTLMHELAHGILNTTNEDDADAFASEILAPRPIIYIHQLKTAEQIRDYFDISISAANRAVISLGYYPDEAGQELLRYFKKITIEEHGAPLEPLRPSRIAGIEIKHPEKMPRDQWEEERESLEKKKSSLRSQLYRCKTDRRRKAIETQMRKLEYRIRWNEEAGERAGYI